MLSTTPLESVMVLCLVYQLLKERKVFSFPALVTDLPIHFSLFFMYFEALQCNLNVFEMYIYLGMYYLPNHWYFNLCEMPFIVTFYDLSHVNVTLLISLCCWLYMVYLLQFLEFVLLRFLFSSDCSCGVYHCKPNPEPCSC